MSCPSLASRFVAPSFFRKVLCALIALAVAMSLGFGVGRATAKDPAPAKKADETADDKEQTPPEPEVADLTTSDDLDLKATFFPGMKKQESIPVILLHGLGPKCNRKDFDQPGGLAEFLQTKLGCAVIVPDLRGHGESTKWSAALQKRLREQHKRPKEPLKPEKLKPADRDAMFREDLRAVKDYLWEKNNKRELNLDKLVVIGVEGSAALALSYAVADATGYEHHTAKYGPLKLGNFLKALVLISPQTKVTGLKAAQFLQDPEFRNLRASLPIMILAGDQMPTYFNEAERLHAQLQGGRPKFDPSMKPEDMTLWFYGKGKVATKLQGAKLINDTSMGVPEKVKTFLKTRLVDNPDAKDWGWRERKLPHQ